MRNEELAVPIGQMIELDAVEQLLCRFLATERFVRNRKNGIVNKKIGSQSNELTDLEGMGAELAFCNLFNVYPDLTLGTHEERNGDDIGDAVLRDGRRVDVKSTTYERGKLIAAPWKKERGHIHLYALITGTFPVYTFRGFLPATVLLTPSRLGNLGYGPCYIALQEELMTLEEVNRA